MTDLETLRRALRAGPGPGSLAGPPDLEAIMARGRRQRARQRLAAAGGLLCLAGVIVATVGGIAHLTRPGPAPTRPQAPGYSQSVRATPLGPRPTGGPGPQPVPSQSAPAPTPTTTALPPAPWPRGGPTGRPLASTAPATAGPNPSGANATGANPTAASTGLDPPGQRQPE
jgi:hypothetical protein